MKNSKSLRLQHVSVTIALFVAVFAVSMTAAAANGLSMLDPASHVEARPGELATIVVLVQNAESTLRSVHPRLELPDGWRLVLESEVAIAPHATETLLVPVLVPSSARPGNYEVAIALVADGNIVDRQTVSVHVGEVRQLRIEHLGDAPERVISGEYRTSFLVSNRGNTVQDVILQLFESPRLGARLERNRLRLEPGRAERVEVIVTIPEQYSRHTLHRLHLMVTSESDPGLRLSALSTVEVVPRRLSEFSRYHTIRTVLDLGWNTEMSDGDTTFTWRWYGSGQLAPDQPGDVSFMLSERRKFLTYETNPNGTTYRLEIGDRPWRLSELTDRQGISAGAGFSFSSPVDFGKAYYRKTPNGHERIGIQYGFYPDENSELSLQYLVQPELAGDLWSIRGQHGSDSGWNLYGEYGVQTASHGEGSWAATVGTRYDVPDMQLIGEWSLEDEGYRGRPVGERTITLGATLRQMRPAVMGARYTHRVTLDSAAEESPSFHGFLRLPTTEYGTFSIDYHYATDDATGPDPLVRQATHLGWSFNLSSNSHVYQRLSWEELSDDVGSTTHATTYQLNYLHQMGSSTANTFFTAKVPDVGETVKYSAGFRWQTRTLNQTRYGIDVQLRDFATHAYRLGADTLIPLDDAGSLRFAIRWDGQRDEKPEVVFSVGIRLPFGLPVADRTDVGGVQGRVVDREGNPVADVVVEIDRIAVVTDGEGFFNFPAVPLGEHYLNLRLPVESKLVSVPITPFRVNVNAGEVIAQEFRLVEGSTLQGSLAYRPEARQTEGDMVNIGDLIEPLDPSVLGGIPLVLVGELGRYVTFTDLDGNFTFKGVAPGIWELQLPQNRLPRGFEFLERTVRVELGEGEVKSVTVAVVPVSRRVIIEEGGVVPVL